VIRINLLEETRTASKKRGSGGGFSMPALDIADNVGVVIMLGGIAAAVVFVGAWWMVTQGTLNTLEEDITKAQKEKAELEWVLKKDEELKAKKKDLAHRIELIHKLKAEQGKPVKMMSELSIELSKAENVWFEDLSFSADKLTLTGKAISKFNYSKFLGNLEESKYFSHVQMGILTETPTRDGTVLVTFKAEAMFVLDGGEKARADAAAAAAADSSRKPPPRDSRNSKK
jgi:Tfp pilus assembly protein PilN